MMSVNMSATVFMREGVHLCNALSQAVQRVGRADLLQFLNLPAQFAPDRLLMAQGPDFDIKMMLVDVSMPPSMWQEYAIENSVVFPEGARHVIGHKAHIMTYVTAATKAGQIKGSLVLSQLIALLEPMAVLWCPAYQMSSGDRFVKLLQMFMGQNMLPLPLWTQFGLEQVSTAPSMVRVTTFGLHPFLGHELRTPPRPAENVGDVVLMNTAFLNWIVTEAQPLAAGHTMGSEGRDSFFQIEPGADLYGVKLLCINPSRKH